MRFNLYRIEPDYCSYLQQFDRCVPYAASSDKITRPFIGVGIEKDGLYYMAPLSSPKPKHIKMKETADFIKIKGGQLGAINLNNMIPVPKGIAKVINLNNLYINLKYSELLKNQLLWCNQPQHRHLIIKKAKNLYHFHKKGKLYPNFEKRCCNFTQLEEKAQEYQNDLDHGQDHTPVLPNQVPSMDNSLGDINFG
ncbi:MAG: type III toxin-antitoxin system ToxN/AbiQ family toxin [Ruminococcus sp.]|nr:type III toxin-antitoxin system ToxN/AbiQ family toxin [Ruminococcus sp.]